MKNIKSQINYVMSIINENNTTTTEELPVIILSDCKKASKILNEKEEKQIVDEYKNWLLNIAIKVAYKSKEGSFLGFGGERFSKEDCSKNWN